MPPPTRLTKEERRQRRLERGRARNKATNCAAQRRFREKLRAQGRLQTYEREVHTRAAEKHDRHAQQKKRPGVHRQNDAIEHDVIDARLQVHTAARVRSPIFKVRHPDGRTTTESLDPDDAAAAWLRAHAVNRRGTTSGASGEEQ